MIVAGSHSHQTLIQPNMKMNLMKFHMSVQKFNFPAYDRFGIALIPTTINFL
jgi:hypothetical protein